MLHLYSVNVAGPSHLAAGLPCQDSAAFANLDGELAVMAVADGLGSESRSDVGSRVAADESVAYCVEHLRGCKGDADVFQLMREAFYQAYDAVLAAAERAGECADQYDATLCLALLNGSRLYWGNAGDSGIVACLADGTYHVVTAMQRDGEGRVFPLCFDEMWEFGLVEDVSTLLLCTDGILEDVLAPPILAVHGDNPVDTSQAEMFLHPRPGDAEDLAEVERQARAYFAAYPKELLDDDKTMVVVFDGDNPPARQPPAYYEVPDWPAIIAKASAALYGAADEAPAREEGEEDDAPERGGGADESAPACGGGAVEAALACGGGADESAPARSGDEEGDGLACDGAPEGKAPACGGAASKAPTGARGRGRSAADAAMDEEAAS